jgi:serine/threonine protein kinase
MNQFHFYDEIGRSKHTVVYKGRKKKTIEYVAIKQIQKSRRDKVDNEVKVGISQLVDCMIFLKIQMAWKLYVHELQMLHGMDSKNIVKFYNYFETSNHLWVIVEFCTGGSLRNIMKEDKCVFNIQVDLSLYSHLPPYLSCTDVFQRPRFFRSAWTSWLQCSTCTVAELSFVISNPR